jgi:hypothetical protein
MGVVKEADKKTSSWSTPAGSSRSCSTTALTLVLGGRVHGGSDRYILDVDTGKGFVLTGILPRRWGGEGAAASDLRASILGACRCRSRPATRARASSASRSSCSPTTPSARAAAQQGQRGDRDLVKARSPTPPHMFIDKPEKLKPTSYEPKVDLAEQRATLVQERGKTPKQIAVFNDYRRYPPVPVTGTTQTEHPRAAPAQDDRIASCGLRHRVCGAGHAAP